MLEYVLVFIILAAAAGALVWFSTGARHAAAATGELMGADAP